MYIPAWPVWSVIGTRYYPYTKCDHLSCHVEMFICKLRILFFHAKWDFVSCVFYTDLSLCRSAVGERTWGSWFEQTHSWFAESPACDSWAWKAGKIKSVTCTGMHCFSLYEWVLCLAKKYNCHSVQYIIFLLTLVKYICMTAFFFILSTKF